MRTETLRTVVKIDDCDLTVETFLDPANQRMVCTLLAGEKVVSQREYGITGETGDSGQAGLGKLLTDTHQGYITELESVFAVCRKTGEKPSPDLCFMTGVILMSFGFNNEARAQFQKALELDPLHVQAAKYYGIALTLLGDYENARAVLDKVLETAPSYPDVLFYLGNVHLLQSHFGEARECYLSALKINPSYAEARLKLATCDIGVLAGAGNQMDEASLKAYLDEAQREAQSAIELNPRIVTDALLTAIENLNAGEYPSAFQSLLNARPKYIAKTGSETIYLYILKILYEDKNTGLQETDAYIRQLEQIVEANPRYPDIRFHYGIALLVKSSFLIHRSWEEVGKALEINPNFQKARASSEFMDGIYKKILEAVKGFYQPED